MTGGSSTFFWVTSRAAGTTAIVLASLAVGVGLTMGGKLIKRRGADRRTLHEILSLSTMVALAVHGFALLGDTWLHPSLLDLTLPFHASYRTLATSIGIVAGWAMMILGLSFYLRGHIGAARWKLIHRFTAIAWLLGLVHAFTDGTDAGRLWFIGLILGTAAPALLLMLVRHLRPGAPLRGSLAARGRSLPTAAVVPPRAAGVGEPHAG